MISPPESKPIREEWYYRYYAEKGADRNSLLRNPEVLFQVLAQDASFYSAMRWIQPDPATCRVLDVGCGNGGSLIGFLRLGFQTGSLHGIDFQKERVRQGNELHPGMNLQWGDATQMDFASDAFDLTHEATMLIHSLDDRLSRKIATEMLRVTRPGGHLVLCDWRYGKPRSGAHKAVTQERIAWLFRVGTQTARCGVFPGALLPPVGRFFSRHLPWAYFPAGRMMPFLVGQVTTVLRKLEAEG
jgi:SAM-dependent methyltransferase